MLIVQDLPDVARRWMRWYRNIVWWGRERILVYSARDWMVGYLVNVMHWLLICAHWLLICVHWLLIHTSLR